MAKPEPIRPPSAAQASEAARKFSRTMTDSQRAWRARAAAEGPGFYVGHLDDRRPVDDSQVSVKTASGERLSIELDGDRLIIRGEGPMSAKGLKIYPGGGVNVIGIEADRG